jgi:hypothetical protein
MDNPVVARKQLTELGILEDSGERRRDSAGMMQVVWRISPLGLIVADYQERCGLTIEQALAVLAETPPTRKPC